MAVAVHLPKVGMTMEEGILVRWLLPEGATVNQGDPLFEMETEKVELEVEADGEGALRQLVAEGTTLKPGGIVGALLAPGETEVPRALLDEVAGQWMKTDGEPGGAERTLAEAAAAPTPAAPEPRSTERGGTPPGRVVATPVARRLAGEHGVDLSQVTGSGPGGRIVEADVRAYLERGAAPLAPSTTTAEAAPPPAPGGGGAAAPYRGRRRTIGERMHQSLQTMAQLTLVSEVRIDDVTRMLHGLNREWRADRVVATLTAVVVKASALALREHPRLNSRLDGETIITEGDVNVGFAVNLDEGLMVPVIRGADRLPLKEVARAVAALNERARSGGLSLDDVSGGTFTVTSLESLEVDAFTPVINPPQAAILGVGRVKQAAVVSGGRVEAGQVTTLSLTFDHRLIDGEPAARFLSRVGELLARPYVLM